MENHIYLDWSNPRNPLSDWLAPLCILENTRPLLVKLSQNLNYYSRIDWPFPITWGITETHPNFRWFKPEFLHCNPATVRKPYSLQIMIIRLGFGEMRKRKEPVWDSWRHGKRTRKGHARDLITESREAWS